MAGIKIVAGQFGDEGNDWVRRLKQNYAGDESGGTSTYYEVFPGVTIFLNRVSASSCVEKRDRRNAMEINFCANGRFECWFEPDDLGVLVPGDVAISTFDGEHGACTESRFPLGFYDGLTIYTDCDEATRWMAKNMRCLGIDLNRLRRQIMTDHWYWIGTAGARCEHVFRELFECVSYVDRNYVRLKVAELFLMLPLLKQQEKETEYFPGSQVELVRHIRDHLISDRYRGATVAEVAALHHISETRLQKIFKQLYGMPVYQYVKQYRLEQATMELVNGSRPITEIALDAGFSSVSKFGESFRKRYGVTPTQYRMQFRDRKRLVEAVEME